MLLRHQEYGQTIGMHPMYVPRYGDLVMNYEGEVIDEESS